MSGLLYWTGLLWWAAVIICGAPLALGFALAWVGERTTWRVEVGRPLEAVDDATVDRMIRSIWDIDGDVYDGCRTPDAEIERMVGLDAADRELTEAAERVGWRRV